MRLGFRKTEKSGTEAGNAGSIESKPAEKAPDRLAVFRDRIGQLAQGPEELGSRVLIELARELEIMQGIFLVSEYHKDSARLKFLAGYACNRSASGEDEFLFGEGLPGQVAKSAKLINLKEIPQGYVTLRTGLGEALPNALIIFPVLMDDRVAGVIELASFHQFTEEDENYLIEAGKQIALAMRKLKANNKGKAVKRGQK